MKRNREYGTEGGGSSGRRRSVLSRNDAVAMGTARALACFGRRPRRPNGRARRSHCLVTERRLRFDWRGASRNTRGRVCSLIPTAYLRLSRNDSVDMGSAAVSAASVGVSPTESARAAGSLKSESIERSGCSAGRRAQHARRVRSPKPTTSLRLSCQYAAETSRKGRKDREAQTLSANLLDAANGRNRPW